MHRDHVVEVLETEANETIGIDEIQEIESLFADMLFEVWLKNISTSQPPVIKTEVVK